MILQPTQIVFFAHASLKFLFIFFQKMNSMAIKAQASLIFYYGIYDIHAAKCPYLYSLMVLHVFTFVTAPVQDTKHLTGYHFEFDFQISCRIRIMLP